MTELKTILADFVADDTDAVGLTAGGGGAGSGNGGYLTTQAGHGGETGGSGGRLLLNGGHAWAGDGDGGNVHIEPGQASGAGVPGYLKILSLPTSDPHSVNAIWNDAGTLKISAG